MTTAIYPGTFDPVTNGHLDILERASRIFDHVLIAVAKNIGKSPMFTLEERIALVRENLDPETNVAVEGFDGLLVDFAREKSAAVIIRGLRAISDFEYEFQMTQMNRMLDSGIETIFLMPTQEYFFTSSRIIKQVAHHEVERLRKLVPPNVASALEDQHP